MQPLSNRVELILFFSYVALGPLMWLFYGTMMVSGRRRMILMKRPPAPLPPSPPSVTIMIPAKDEGQRIRACVLSALRQDYPSFDVICIDDRSTDDTGKVMDDIAAVEPKLRVIHIKQPPGPGWTGKNNALFTGAGQAGGEWLLFVDSDVVLQPDALSVGMSVVLRKNFDLLSLLPRLESHTLWESLLVPLAAGAASSMYLIALNNNAQLNVAFANGQYLMISRKAYDAIGGHETVKDRYCEDVEIARQLKNRGLRPRVSWGNEFASVRMYSSLDAIFRGWSRIYYAAQVGRPWRILTAMTFLLLCCFPAYAAMAWGIYRIAHPGTALWGYAGWAWVFESASHLATLTYFLGLMYHWSGIPRRNALLFPLGGSMLLAIFLRALRMCITKKVEWRGTAYSHTMASTLGQPAPATEKPG